VKGKLNRSVGNLWRASLCHCNQFSLNVKDTVKCNYISRYTITNTASGANSRFNSPYYKTWSKVSLHLKLMMSLLFANRVTVVDKHVLCKEALFRGVFVIILQSLQSQIVICDCSDCKILLKGTLQSLTYFYTSSFNVHHPLHLLKVPLLRLCLFIG
jgi:hypothetical protein